MTEIIRKLNSGEYTVIGKNVVLNDSLGEMTVIKGLYVHTLSSGTRAATTEIPETLRLAIVKIIAENTLVD